MISFFSYIYAPATILFFFFNDTATTEIYTLSLHDALPIWRSDPLDLPFTRERDGAAERGLASFELPREAPDDEALVLELGRFDLPSQILDVDAVLRKQRVVSELVGGVGEHLLHGRFAAEFLLRLRAHLIALAVGAFPEKASYRQVHRVVGGHTVDTPHVDLLLQQPRHQIGVRAGMVVVVALLVRRGAEVRVPVPSRVQQQQITRLHLNPLLDHLRGVYRQLVHLVPQVHDHARAAQPLER